VPAGELARTVGVPKNTMSAHLTILSRAGLATGERQSRSIIYRAVPVILKALGAVLIIAGCKLIGVY